MNGDSTKLNGGLDSTALRLRLNRRINLLDFPKFGGIRGLDSVQNSNALSFPWFADIRYVWNTPVLYNYPSIRNEVLNSTRVQTKIAELVAINNEPYSKIASQARRFYNGIRASISRLWCRFLGYLMFKIFRRLMSRLLIDPAQLKALKKAHDTNIPIVYLPLHRSHMDCQIITWTVWHFGCRIQHVASGDNLNLSGFGWFLRATGAFFIKRNIDPNDLSTRDVLYRAVLKSYMIGLLKNGQSLEFFLEGTRSRMGKTLLPKNGLISNIIEAVENGELNDVYLVPVSVNYDALIEGIFYHELMGIRKPKENIVNVFRGMLESFRQRFACGTVCVDFGKPVLLSEELKAIRKSVITRNGLDYATNFNSYRELLPWDDQILGHKTLIRAVGYHVVCTAQNQQPVNVPSLISILFLGKYRTKVVKMSELLTDLQLLIKEIQDLSYEVVGWFIDETTPENLILNAIQYLEGSLIIDLHDGVYTIQINDYHKSWISLTYHKNSALHVFTLISIAAVVLNMKQINGAALNLVRQAQILCSFLRYEVLLCSPLESLEERIQLSLQFFSNNQNAFELQFYTHLISPFMDTLNYVADHLLKNPTKYIKFTDTAFIRHITTEMAADKTMCHEEAANSDSVYNSLKALRIWNAVNETKIELLSEYLINQIISQLRLFIDHGKIA